MVKMQVKVIRKHSGNYNMTLDEGKVTEEAHSENNYTEAVARKPARQNVRKLNATKPAIPAKPVNPKANPVPVTPTGDASGGEKMKALSVKQPLAGLIIAGIKNVENRSWAPNNYTGRLVIVSTATAKR